MVLYNSNAYHHKEGLSTSNHVDCYPCSNRRHSLLTFESKLVAMAIPQSLRSYSRSQTFHINFLASCIHISVMSNAGTTLTYHSSRPKLQPRRNNPINFQKRSNSAHFPLLFASHPPLLLQDVEQRQVVLVFPCFA